MGLRRSPSKATIVANGGARTRMVVPLTDEQERRYKPVDREERQLELVASLRHNQAEMRARLADVAQIGVELKETESKLEGSIVTSKEAAEQLQKFNEEMAGDFELMTQ